MRQLRIVTCVAALSLIGVSSGCDPDPVDPVDAGGDSGDDLDSGGPIDSGDPVDTGTPPGMCAGPTGDCSVTDTASCGTGMACVMVGSTADGWATACIMAGVGGSGATCDPTMMGQCQEGFQCDDGTCKTICCVTSDCPTTGDFCQMIGGADAGFCQTPVDCDLIAQTGCETMAGTGCYPSGGGLQCAGAGMAAEGDYCRFVNECSPGAGCIGAAPPACTTAADCDTGIECVEMACVTSQCRNWCDMSADPDPCPMDFACTGVTGLPVGACTPATP